MQNVLHLVFKFKEVLKKYTPGACTAKALKDKKNNCQLSFYGGLLPVTCLLEECVFRQSPSINTYYTNGSADTQHLPVVNQKNSYQEKPN